MKSKTKNITHSALIAALYVVLTLLSNAVGLANGAIQVRVSEALTILPIFTSAAIPGLTLGCLLSNLLTGCPVWDIIFGTFATLIGAIGTYLLKNFKYVAMIPPILSNTIIIPFVLRYTYGVAGSLPYLMLTVGIGEVISIGIIGTLFLKVVEKYQNNLFN